MKWNGLLGWSLGLFLSLGGLTPASAQWVRSKSEDGIELFWGKFPVVFSINQSGSSDVTEKTGTYDAIKASFQAWMNPACTCFEANFAGLTTVKEVGYDSQAPEKNVNSIFFQQTTWPHAGQAVAVTSTVFNKSTGEIVAFDVEFNDRDFFFSLDGKPKNGRATIDLQNTMTHEAGHVVGLDHSPTKTSVMFASAPPGEITKRTLTSEDSQAVCSLYNKNLGGCQISKSKQAIQAEGCSCQALSPSSSSLGLGLFLLFALAFLRRRTRSLPNPS